MLSGQISRLTTDELLNYVDHVAHHSPIMSELVKRLKDLSDKPSINHLNHKVECPVCMANLQVDIDWGNNMFTVRVSPFD